MKRIQGLHLAFLLPITLVKYGFAAGGDHPPIQISDGPMEYSTAEHAGKRVNGAWVVETDGPGTGRLIGAKPSVKSKIVISDGPGLPEPERSALAPVIGIPHPAKALQPAPQKTVVTIDRWTRPRKKNVFYVYSDKQFGGHFLPTGWMGDYGDVRIETGSQDHPHSGSTCIRIDYLARSSQGNGWAGLYWQTPADNWGDKAGGYDLSGKKRLAFWARGDKGGEVISDFRVGGIGGKNGDSDSANIGPITLTKEWQKFTISLTQKNLRHIIGGFSWSANRDANPHGITFYLDDIRYE